MGTRTAAAVAEHVKRDDGHDLFKLVAKVQRHHHKHDSSASVPAVSTFWVAAPDAGAVPRVKVFDAATGHQVDSFLAYPRSFRGGVRVAVGDVTGDGTADIVTGAGPGGGSQVRVIDGKGGEALSGTLGGFDAFAPGESNGIFVAAGDVDGDGHADVIVGGDGAAPAVNVFSGKDGSLLAAYTLAGLAPAGGAPVAAGDVDGDGRAELIVGGGPGGPPRVLVLDAATGAVVYDFFAFDPADTGGVYVGAGDVNGDGKADILAGNGAGSWLRVFSGADTTPLRSVQAFEDGFSGGVRVAAVDATGDGKLDLLAGAGPGGGQVKLFDAVTGEEVRSKTPFGGHADAGLFVGGDPTSSPGVSPLDVLPIVTISATTPCTAEGSGSNGGFTVTRTGDTTGPLTVYLSIGGTATPTTDYSLSNVSSNTVTISAGSSSATIGVSAVDDSLYELTETVVITVASGSGYTVGTPSSDTVVIEDNDGPPVLLPEGGSHSDELVKVAQGLPALGSGFSDNGLRYADGTVRVEMADLASAGIGAPWGHTLNWTNGRGYASTTVNGNNTVVSQLPYLVKDSAGVIAVITNGTTARYFDPSGSNYVPRFYLQESLTNNSTTHELTFVDTTGNKIVFNNFDSAVASGERGLFKSLTDADGNTTSVTSRAADGKPTEVQRTDSTSGVTESYLYTYSSGRLSNVTLRRQVSGGSWTTVRQVDYTYYSSGDSNGTAGDLKFAVIKDGSGTTLDTNYYRYYTSDTSIGFTGGLKYAFGAASWGRLAAAFSDPTTASDSAVSGYADLYLEYDSLHRVKTQTVQGAGCSSCTAGLGTYTYTYTSSGFPDGYNSWRRKTTETLPDGNQNIVYTNFAGEVMLFVHKEGTSEWRTANIFDTSGRIARTAQPSAVSGYDDTRPDLLNSQSGNYQYLNDSSGLIVGTTYYTSTTATDSTAGGVLGYVQQSGLSRGEGGTISATLSGLGYFAHSGGGVTVYPIATGTAFRNADASGAETTSTTYTWGSSSTHIVSAAVSLPVISSSQNGPGSADTSTVVNDAYGRTVWVKDGDGYIHYTAYDPATGAVVKTITDVDTTRTSDFSNLPSGWSTPSGGGLHLVTTFEVDAIGRTTKTTDPNGNITYTVFNDTTHEVRIYRGWNTSTNMPTGPTAVYREDRAGGYTESLTMSATPTVSGGRPTGTESISSLQSLSRNYTNSAGQVIYRDEYFNLSGLTYSTSTTLGTENTHFYRTRFAYDNRGRLVRVQLPTGTIERTVYDGQGRVASTWVGTNDTPAFGSWSPANNTSPSNMVKVSENQYDSGGTGDGLLTQTTAIVGGGATDRVSRFYYDWRDRQVASKAGVEGTESTSLNRPISYAEYDNLDDVIVSEWYDGDNVTVSDSNNDGVPDRPSSSLLRGKSVASFDDQQRQYRSQVYSVDPNNGTVSTYALTTNVWFDHRSEVIKTAAAGESVTKNKYDGAGRAVKVYTTDGGGDTSWSDAGNVTGDAVLVQVETTYDGVANPLLVTTRQRFHDESATGELGNPTTAPKARVSYVASYYDLANRLTDTVDVGTNGGSAYTRSSSVPSRSDTVRVVSRSFDAAGWEETATDTRGIVTKAFHNAMGWLTKTIEAYTDCTVTDTSNKTTEYTHDGDGHVLTLKAFLTGGGCETTQFVYGVTTGSGGSAINSNDVLAAVNYPGKTSGDPSESEKETYTVDALGETVTLSDRNGSVHTYSRDVVGRLTTDAVTTLGSGVDGAVRRLEVGYNSAGDAYLFTSYDASSGGNVVNQVQENFNGLGQLTTEYQAHAGAVNTATTPNVQYAFSEIASGVNHSRLVSMTYPNGKVLNYNYSSGIDDTISRLSSLSDSTATLEAFAYFGADIVVRRSHPQTGIDLSYVKRTGESDGDAGDPYTGLDRFFRVVDQRWLNASSGTATDRFGFGYDRDSNRLYRENLINAAFSELYHADGSSNGFDNLNQLAAFQRGTLNAGKDTIATADETRSQSWDVDALGNFDSVTTDGATQSRTANRQNQVTSITGLTTPAYDGNGNMTTDQSGKTLVFDAWNHLVKVKSGSTTLAACGYDALGRRIIEDPITSTAKDLYYSDAWQVIEEREGSLVRDQYVWSPVYVDAMVLRDRDADGNGTLEERLYVQQDANFNVTALVNTSGTVVERFIEDPYGSPSFLTGSWGSQSGSQYAWVYVHQGGRYDSTSGLFHFRNRDFSPALARWVERDPSEYGAGDVNLYRGLAGDPLGNVDPSGLAGSKRTIAAYMLPVPPKPITRWSAAKPLHWDADDKVVHGKLPDDFARNLPQWGDPPFNAQGKSTRCKELARWVHALSVSIANRTARYVDSVNELDELIAKGGIAPVAITEFRQSNRNHAAWLAKEQILWTHLFGVLVSNCRDQYDENDFEVITNAYQLGIQEALKLGRVYATKPPSPSGGVDAGRLISDAIIGGMLLAGVILATAGAPTGAGAPAGAALILMGVAMMEARSPSTAMAAPSSPTGKSTTQTHELRADPKQRGLPRILDK